MFFILSKILLFALNPLFWVLGLIGLGRFSKSPKNKKRYKNIGIGLLIFVSLPIFSDLALKSWCPTVKSFDSVETYKYGIVLGGFSNPSYEPLDRIHFNANANRLTDAYTLFLKGKIKNIILSGGSGKIGGDLTTEAENSKLQLLNWGIPDSCILIEQSSRNTYENLKNTLHNFPELKKEKCLLFTSSFHMTRSSLIAKKLTIKHDAFPTSFGENTSISFLNSMIPSGGSIDTWKQLIKEWVGIVVYWLKGYL